MLLAQDETEAIETLSRLTLEDWLIAGGIFVGSLIAARILSYTIRRVLTAWSPASEGGARLVGRFAAYLVVVFGFVYALNTVNVPIAPLLGALGVIGLALALAFQDILENFVAGIGMQLRRPLRIGDEISTNEYEGTIIDITMRTVIVTTFDGERVYLPNSLVWKNPMVNATERATRRTTLTVGVAYGTDLDLAKRVLERSAAAIEDVLAEPAPLAQVVEFGESSIDFAVRYWHRPQMATLWRVRDELARRIKRDLDAAGIQIPFPQRVVHLPAGER